MSEKGILLGLMGNSVKDNQTIEKIEGIFKTAKQNGLEVFIFPHYYYPTDYAWKFAETLEQMILEFKEFIECCAFICQATPGSDYLTSQPETFLLQN